MTEYIALEQSTDTKHEYHDGKVFAMAGGTLEHGLISGNIFAEVRGGIRKQSKDCTAINNEVKLYIPTINKYLYPDAMAICGSLERAEEEPNAVLNSTLIIEVLSKSTESYDRGDKFHYYRKIRSLQEYLLIDQYQPQIDAYSKTADLWEITRVEGLDAKINIASLGISLP